MFKRYIIDQDNQFLKLSRNIEFENVGKGRKGAILVRTVKDMIPIVRTTTSYAKPAQSLDSVHLDLIDRINKICKLNTKFNNAMVEIYDSSYRKMGFHTDQALDLEKDSFICLFSSYEKDPSNDDLRKLVIKNKITNEISEIVLVPNSVVLFSTAVNQEHLHKIVPNSDLKFNYGEINYGEINYGENRWLGITFRVSKTFVKFVDGLPMIKNINLKLANLSEKREFQRLKGRENMETNFEYPDVTITISESDLIPIKINEK